MTLQTELQKIEELIENSGNYLNQILDTLLFNPFHPIYNTQKRFEEAKEYKVSRTSEYFFLNDCIVIWCVQYNRINIIFHHKNECLCEYRKIFSTNPSMIHISSKPFTESFYSLIYHV